LFFKYTFASPEYIHNNWQFFPLIYQLVTENGDGTALPRKLNKNHKGGRMSTKAVYFNRPSKRQLQKITLNVGN